MTAPDTFLFAQLASNIVDRCGRLFYSIYHSLRISTIGKNSGNRIEIRQYLVSRQRIFRSDSESGNFILIFWNIMERNRFDLEINLFHRLHSINDCAPFELLTIDLVCIYFFSIFLLFLSNDEKKFKEKNDRRKERKRKYTKSITKVDRKRTVDPLTKGLHSPNTMTRTV